MLKVLIADDHAVVRRGVIEVLAEEFKDAKYFEAKTAPQALEHVRREDWSVVILDISMPGNGGMDVLEEIKRERPKLPVIMLSIHPEEQFAKRALKTGASAYLTKESLPEELIRAVRKVLAGGRYISTSLAEKLAYDITRETERPLHENLSNREFQILRLIASGKTLTEIAHELSLSVQTVSTYRSRLMEKMGMRKNAELIRYAVENRLVD